MRPLGQIAFTFRSPYLPAREPLRWARPLGRATLAEGEVIAVRQVESIGAGEAALVSLVSELTNEKKKPLSASSGWSTNEKKRVERALFQRVVHSLHAR